MVQKRFAFLITRYSHFILLILIQIGPFDLYGQEEVHFDSVKVKKDHYITFGGKTIYCRTDTVLILADTVDYFQSRWNTTEQSDKFYGKIKKRLKRKDNRINRTLYKVAFGKDQSSKPKTQVESGMNYFRPYRNRTVSSIHLKKLDIFGTNIKDTAKVAKKPLLYLNKLHVNTHNRIIYHNLLLEEGHILKPAEAADSERILRQLPYIKDAKLMVAKRSGRRADVAVVTKDVFPLRIDFSPSIISGNSFGFSNINIFGTGHEFQTELNFNDRDRDVSHDSYLKIRNIRGTFVDSWINVAESFSKSGAGVLLFRDFVTPNTLYAGGGEFSRYTFRDIVLPNGQKLGSNAEDPQATIIKSIRNTQDVWIGRAFNGISDLPAFLDLRRWRMLAAIRLNRVAFSERPQVSENNNEPFHNRTRILLSVGLSSRHYYKDVLVNLFGRTEDIPAGNLLQLTVGQEFGQFKNRKYLGVKFTKGDFIPHFGYLRGEIDYGGFYNNGDVEQGVMQTKFNYFTRLYTYHFLKIRFFLNMKYTVGIRRANREIIDFDDPFGIRGYGSVEHSGTRRFIIDQESVFFTPIYFLGFRLVAFTFMDVGFLSGLPFSGPMQGALGGGIRLRNENLAFNTIQFRFGYYPNAPFDMSPTDFVFSTKVSEPIQDFDLREPTVVEFN